MLYSIIITVKQYTNAVTELVSSFTLQVCIRDVCKISVSKTGDRLSGNVGAVDCEISLTAEKLGLFP